MSGNGHAKTAWIVSQDVETMVAEKVARREMISKNINVPHDQRLTLGQRMAAYTADAVGSWNFIITFLVLIAVWIGINAILLIARPWDPYPFILLSLLLSLVAGLQAPTIMMSQNCQESKDRIRAEHDYEVNVKAEMEIGQLHEKLNSLREKQWSELVEIQQRQIVLLKQQMKMLRGLVQEA